MYQTVHSEMHSNSSGLSLYRYNVMIITRSRYRRSGFNREYLLIVNCEFLYASQLIDSQT